MLGENELDAVLWRAQLKCCRRGVHRAIPVRSRYSSWLAVAGIAFVIIYFVMSIMYAGVPVAKFGDACFPRDVQDAVGLPAYRVAEQASKLFQTTSLAMLPTGLAAFWSLALCRYCSIVFAFLCLSFPCRSLMCTYTPSLSREG
jgi:hypothetical protein